MLTHLVGAFVIMVHLRVEQMYFGVLIRVVLLVAYFAEISRIHRDLIVQFLRDLALLEFFLIFVVIVR